MSNRGQRLRARIAATIRGGLASVSASTDVGDRRRIGDARPLRDELGAPSACVREAIEETAPASDTPRAATVRDGTTSPLRGSR